MYKKNTVLRVAEHGQMTLSDDQDYSFACEAAMVPILISELAEVAREYPIVFPSDQTLPHALLGLGPGNNAYVGEDGNWRAHYIPLFIRRYPFAMVPVTKEDNSDDESRFVIAFDSEAPQLNNGKGQQLFNSEGKPTRVMQARIEILKTIEKDRQRTQQQMTMLQKSGLLKDRLIKISRPNQAPYQVNGLQIIDEAAFNDLETEEFLKIRHLLPLIYSHLLSWANLKQGPIGGKYPLMQTSKWDFNDLSNDRLLDFSQYS
jgi:hypothetical protein